MSDEEIFNKLDISGANEAVKQACLVNINTVVQLKAVQALADILTDEQMSHLEEMEKANSSQDDILWWLGENVASAHEMIDALTRDYVDELSAKYKQ